MMTVGTGGFSGSAAATGPVAGFDPMLDFRKKMARRIKDHPYAQEYKAKRAKAKKIKESVEKPCPTPHLYQYKVSIPEVGETIIYASSAAELTQKLRLLVNPRYRGDIKIDRIFPSEAGKFYNEKRMKAYKNIPEETDPGADAAKDAAKKQQDQMKKQMAQKQVSQKIAMEKKKIQLKKQAMQKDLQTKIAAMKKGASAGVGPQSASEEVEVTEAEKKLPLSKMNKKAADLERDGSSKSMKRRKNIVNTMYGDAVLRMTRKEEVVQESSGGNIDAIKKIADSNQPGKIQFLNGESFHLQPAIAQKIFQAYEQLGAQKNRAKFSNAANETSQSFEKILSFVGAQG